MTDDSASNVTPKTPIPHRFYGRRLGRPLKNARAEALSQLADYQVPPGTDAIEAKTLFPVAVQDVWLEIGFGNGEHMIGQLQNNPGIGLIGCEPFVNGVSAALKDAAAAGVIDRLRVHADDARHLLPRLPQAGIGRAFVLFSDPWPKTRHHRRRFIQPETLDMLARLLRPGAELRIATDHPDLAGWSVEQVTRHPGFEWRANRMADWQTAPEDWVPTRYQMKALADGRPSFYIRAWRV